MCCLRLNQSKINAPNWLPISLQNLWNASGI
uniref:Uncharacterized protein n=1 Tax=Anguilla anguilla TaxID=7936 RepID=A0A0E9V476_ANGAN